MQVVLMKQTVICGIEQSQHDFGRGEPPHMYSNEIKEQNSPNS